MEEVEDPEQCEKVEDLEKEIKIIKPVWLRNLKNAVRLES